MFVLSEKNKLYAIPYIGFSYMHTQAAAFDESGSDKAFDVDDISGDSLRLRAGYGLTWNFELAGDLWRVGLSAAYSYDLLGDEVDTDVTTRSGKKISETAQVLPESVLLISPSVNVDLTSTMSVYGAYTFSTGTDSYVNHSANLGFRMRF